MLRAALLTATGLVGAALAGGAVALRHPVFGGRAEGARQARIAASPQFAGGRFRNALPDRRVGDPSLAWKWLLERSAHRVPSAPPETRRLTAADFAAPPADGLRLTWLGHATTLIELDGRRFLTDPVWSAHAAPSPLLGVRRFFDPPLALEALPPLEAVLLSHDHYDHLDAATIGRLAARVPRFVAPLGVGAHLERWGVAPERITELDWWEEAGVAGVIVTCTPARHFSGRRLTDRNATLWGGWALAGPARRVYVSGDGGYGPHFAEIGRRLGPFDAALVEIGAYDPAWADLHMGPEQAVQAFQDVRADLLVPAHWGTFNLAFHGWTEPAERLLCAAEAAGVAVAVPRPGQPVEPADGGPAADVERWWPALPWRTADERPVVSSGVVSAGGVSSGVVSAGGVSSGGVSSGGVSSGSASAGRA
ncbi:MAG: MBL fold metallo-hydrolase [Rubricoccaceae bacterium]